MRCSHSRLRLVWRSPTVLERVPVECVSALSCCLPALGFPGIQCIIRVEFLSPRSSSCTHRVSQQQPTNSSVPLITLDKPQLTTKSCRIVPAPSRSVQRDSILRGCERTPLAVALVQAHSGARTVRVLPRKQFAVIFVLFLVFCNSALFRVNTYC